MVRSRKKIDKEKDILPLVNTINDLIIELNYIKRTFSGISLFGINDLLKDLYKTKSKADKTLLKGYKSPKEYKKILKLYKESQRYYSSLF